MIRSCATIVAGLLWLSSTAGGQCPSEWTPDFALDDLNGPVRALAVFDDGMGAALYVGGEFTDAGGVAVNKIAKWDGQVWSPLGEALTSPMNARVSALTVWNSPVGPRLCVAGWFNRAGGLEVRSFAMWDGQSWSAVDDGLNPGSEIFALATYDTGVGAELYSGSASGVKRCTGAQWEPVGAFAAGWAYALAVFDDGTGPRLFAGGSFGDAGGVTALNVAAWNGSNWAPVGSGFDGTVWALAAVEDDAGPSLLAGGTFTLAGATIVNRIARWSNQNWEPLAGGLNGGVFAIRQSNQPGSSDIYVGGEFTAADGLPSPRLAVWDGQSWSLGDVRGSNQSIVRCFCNFDDGSGLSMYMGGEFWSVDGIAAPYLGALDNEGWRGVGRRDGVNANPVVAITVHDGGAGDELYVGGWLRAAGDHPVRGIAKWDGYDWLPVASINENTVNAFASFDSGAGVELYAAGDFTLIDGVPANRIARWDGVQWQPLGQGLNGPVQTMTVYDDENGPALFVGGNFTQAGGASAMRVAKWDGSAWSPLGSGLRGGSYAWVHQLVPFVNGLYAVGWFNRSGTTLTGGVARWDGQSWHPVGASQDIFGVYSAAVLTSEDTPRLYIGGQFTVAGGVPAGKVACWDGAQWSAVGDGFTNSFQSAVYALAADPSQTLLYATGILTQSGPTTVNNVALWNGSTWMALGDGLNGQGNALGFFEDDRGPAVYVGGDFSRSGPHCAGNLARWAIAGPTIVQQPVDQQADAGTAATFEVEASGQAPLTYRWRRNRQPLSNGGPISGADSPTLTINPVAAGDTGDYDVLVSDGCGGTRSDPARLIVVVPPCPGDLNGDQVVSLADLTQLLAHFGQADGATLADGDLDADGDVDINDLAALLSAFGTTCA